MKPIAKKSFFCALILLATSAASAQEIGGGVIHFTGMIVEPVCEFSHTNTQISSKCMHDGKMVVNNTPITDLHRAIPRETGEVTTKWLDPQHKLGVMTVSYN